MMQVLGAEAFEESGDVVAKVGDGVPTFLQKHGWQAK